MSDGAGTPVIIERQHCCPVCGRFLSASRMPEDLKPGVVQSRSLCRTCGKWRWYDVAIGVIRAAA